MDKLRGKIRGRGHYNKTLVLSNTINFHSQKHTGVIFQKNGPDYYKFCVNLLDGILLIISLIHPGRRQPSMKQVAPNQTALFWAQCIHGNDRMISRSGKLIIRAKEITVSNCTELNAFSPAFLYVSAILAEYNSIERTAFLVRPWFGSLLILRPVFQGSYGWNRATKGSSSSHGKR